MYTKSLKRALDLPLQTPNSPLLAALGVPSLRQIAAHHISKNADIIRDRFSELPATLELLAKELSGCSEEYTRLQNATPIAKQADGHLTLDLLAPKVYLNKCILGLATGTFLTIRFSGGNLGIAGQVRNCPKCLEPATQEHFLNICPVNATARTLLCRSVPSWVLVKHFASRDFNAFYRDIRHVETQMTRSDGEEILRDSLYHNLANAAAGMAELFTKTTLELFG
jgi:hypothetical protein